MMFLGQCRFLLASRTNQSPGPIRSHSGLGCSMSAWWEERKGKPKVGLSMALVDCLGGE
jgi:hypothetical protein